MAAKTASRKQRSFYGRALSRAERAGLPAALELEGLDQEVAVLRLRLRTALKERPEELPLLLKGIEVLARLVAARYRLPKQDEQALEDKLKAMNDEIVRLLEEAPSG